jgi:hypothetical protein
MRLVVFHFFSPLVTPRMGGMRRERDVVPGRLSVFQVP